MKANWVKKGLIYVPEGKDEWRFSHAQMPVVDLRDNGVARIFFGTRDASSHTVTTYIDVKADNPANVLYEHDQPVLGRGALGCFDDGGSMPSWILNHGGKKFLYYVGWNAGVTVGYRNSIGIAVSEDGGNTFDRMFPGPIVDRDRNEPQFCSTPCVLVEDGLWRMWYLTGISWEMMDGHPEPLNHIRYAESRDGIEWVRTGTVAIELRPDEGGMTKPHVIHEDGVYKMWYSYRGARGYREDPSQAYRIGYAESADGISWTRMDDRAGIDVSAGSWDSVMLAFPCLYDYGGRRFLLYNGDGFGKTGIGYAVLE